MNHAQIPQNIVGRSNVQLYAAVIPLHTTGVNHGKDGGGKGFRTMTMSNVDAKSTSFWYDYEIHHLL